jgi:hypothetical protein
MPFAIRPGSVTQLDVRLLPGSIAMIRCTLPADADPGQQVEIAVRSAAGAVVLRGSAWRHGNQCELQATLQPGDYRVTAQAGGLRGEAPLVVTAGERAQVEIALAR